MRNLLLATAAVAVTAVALPASAQILGGQVGVNVGAGVTAPRPGAIVGPVVGQVGQTVRGTAGVARDTVRDTRDVVASRPDVDVDASVQTDASASADREGADAGLNVRTGAMVHASDGNMLGSVVRLTRDSAGRVENLVVRSADGTLRAVPATGASVQGDAVVTAWTSGEFDRAPPLR
ncbi:hypothetical protein BH09PSE1_BH09PSE1_17510 [soil metagenome]